jgi:hypothetical protein
VISLDDYWMGRNSKYPDEWSFDIAENAAVLLSRVNLLLSLYYAATGYPQPEVSSGWRPHCINVKAGGAKNSAHVTGEAIDLRDPYDHLDDWLMTPEGRLALMQCDLYLEHPTATNTWCHLQTRPPRSKNRVFHP